MKTGYLASIRWEPLLTDLTAKLAKNPLARSLAQTGIPRPPYGMPVIQEARFFLRAAAEVEHALLVQYLYGHYSLTNAAWAGTLRTIAIQEMAHLITVQNLLLAVGSEPSLDRQTPINYSIPFALEPFSQSSLAKYITTEAPSIDKIPAGKQALVVQIEAIANQSVSAAAAAAGPFVVPFLTIQHVGALYAVLYWLFLPTDKIEGPWIGFPADMLPAGRHLAATDLSGLASLRQAETAEWNNGDDLLVVRPVREAKPKSDKGPLQAIYDIAIQGEGWEDAADSHFNKFFKLWKPVNDAVQAGIVFTQNVPANPSVNPTSWGTRTITHPVSVVWARLFNCRYQMLLLKIIVALSKPSNDSTPGPAGRAQLVSQAIALEMSIGVNAIAQKLVSLPLKPRVAAGAPLELAAPPFELPNDHLPEDSKSQCQRLIHLIDEANNYITALRAVPAGDPDQPTVADKTFTLKPLDEDDQALKTALQALLKTM